MVLGGARSGKSELAEQIAAKSSSQVTYVATADATGDSDLAERIDRHIQRRPEDWMTRRVGPGSELADLVATQSGTLLIDSVGTWVAQHDDFAADIDALVSALLDRQEHTIIVSEEVGLGVHPSTEVGRRFRDALGDVNIRLANVADTVILAVAGQPLVLRDNTNV